MKWPCIVLLVCAVSTAFTADQTSRVVYIHDGDTIVAMLNGHAQTIRLNGIDCPETGESKGNRAKKFVTQSILGKNVVLKTHGKDKYGRTIADLYLVDGTLFNHQLVRNGNCKWGKSRAMTN